MNKNIKSLLPLVWLFLGVATLCGLAQAQLEDSPLRVESLPPILKILEQEPQSLDDIEKLIRFHGHEKALQALEAYPPEEERVLYLKGLALAGLKRYEEALSTFEEVLKKDGQRKFRWASFFKKGQLLSKLKRYPESLGVLDQLLHQEKRWHLKSRLKWVAFKTALETKEYREGLFYLRSFKDAKGFWWRGWCYFRMNDFASAVENWNHIPKKRSHGFYPKALFWKAQVLKDQRILQELIQEFPNSYYSFLAIQELGLYVPTNNPSFEKYPLVFENIIRKQAKGQKLDPYLILALIRQESNFKEWVVSPAGAMGLMQIIPQTASWLAKALKRKDFQWVHAFVPEVNIELGIFYLKFLMELFDKELPLVIAAYNAGEEAVARWLSLRKGDSMEIFIEEIPYDQTQNYVQRVLTNYWNYHWLYRGKWPSFDYSVPKSLIKE